MSEAREVFFALVNDCIFTVMFWYNTVGCRLRWSIVHFFKWNVENVKIISMFYNLTIDVNYCHRMKMKSLSMKIQCEKKLSFCNYQWQSCCFCDMLLVTLWPLLFAWLFLANYFLQIFHDKSMHTFF